MNLILASGSPRRRALLEELGLEPVIRPADIDETPLPGEDPKSYVERLAREKAGAVEMSADDLVVAADTIVTIDGEILGKPVDNAHAANMLRRLSGRTHEVMTGVATRDGSGVTSFVEVTTVHFAELSDDEIDWYVSTGEPADKAGAYAIQGRGGAFVEAIEGSHDNVIGLPRARLRHVLARHGTLD